MDIVPHLLWPIAGFRRVRLLHGVLGFALTALALTALGLGASGTFEGWATDTGRFLDGVYDPTSTVAAVSAGCLLVFPPAMTRTCSLRWPEPVLKTSGRGSGPPTG